MQLAWKNSAKKGERGMRLGYFQVNVHILTIGLDQLDRCKMPMTKALHKIDYYPWIG